VDPNDPSAVAFDALGATMAVRHGMHAQHALCVEWLRLPGDLLISELNDGPNGHAVVLALYDAAIARCG
jgi:hypothetical protein